MLRYGKLISLECLSYKLKAQDENVRTLFPGQLDMFKCNTVQSLAAVSDICGREKNVKKFRYEPAGNATGNSGSTRSR